MNNTLRPLSLTELDKQLREAGVELFVSDVDLEQNDHMIGRSVHAKIYAYAHHIGVEEVTEDDFNRAAQALYE